MGKGPGTWIQNTPAFAAALRAWMRGTGTSERALAQRCGCSVATIHNIAHAEHGGSEWITRVCEVTGLEQPAGAPLDPLARRAVVAISRLAHSSTPTYVEEWVRRLEADAAETEELQRKHEAYLAKLKPKPDDTTPIPTQRPTKPLKH